MGIDESQQSFQLKRSSRLNLNFVEQVLIASMLLVLGATMLDAFNGQQVGKGDALEIAKRQAQQELMAARIK